MELSAAKFRIDKRPACYGKPYREKTIPLIAMNELRYELMKSVQKTLVTSFESSRDMLVPDSPSGSSYTDLLKMRIYGQQPTLRSFFVIASFQYLLNRQNQSQRLSRQKERFAVKDLPFIVEVLISVHYYHNHVLDGKFGVKSEVARHDCMLKANMLRSFLDQYLLAKCPKRIYPEIRTIITRSFDCVDIGQRFEREQNRYVNWKNATDSIRHERCFIDFIDQQCIDDVQAKLVEYACFFGKEAFLVQYLRRIFLTNASLYVGVVEILETLFGFPAECLRTFAMRFGMMKQIVNDIADLVPSFANIGTRTRLPQDAFSDLKHHNITLPLMLMLLKNPKGEMASWLEANTAWTFETEGAIAQELVESLVVYRAMSLSRRVRDLAINHLDASNPAFTLLEDMCHVADVNKFYRYFDKMKYSKWYRRTKAAC